MTGSDGIKTAFDHKEAHRVSYDVGGTTATAITKNAQVNALKISEFGTAALKGDGAVQWIDKTRAQQNDYLVCADLDAEGKAELIYHHEGVRRQVDLEGNGDADFTMPFGAWHWSSDAILFLMEGYKK